MERLNEYAEKFPQGSVVYYYEWNKKNLEHELNRYQGIYNVSNENIEQIKDFILKQSDFEDLDFRMFDGKFQFKSYNKKKWINADFA